MTASQYYFTISFIFLFILLSCNKAKDKDVSPVAVKLNPVPKNVFIAGADKGAAVYWNDGKEIYLTDTNTNSIAYAISVAGNDVYVAGNDGRYPKYWKNGKGYPLPNSAPTNGPILSFAKAIYVNNNDVYIIGHTQYGSGEKSYVGCNYWKNGNEVHLEPNGDSVYATCMTGKKEDVYIGGYIGNHGAVWKNGKLQKTDLATWVNTIAIVDNDIYISSTEKISDTLYNQKYWKNYTPIELSEFKGPLKNRVVVGNDIYQITITYAKFNYLKNGSSIDLETKLSHFTANEIKVVENKIYLSGGALDKNYIQYPAFCADNKCFILSDNLGSQILDFFVTPQHN